MHGIAAEAVHFHEVGAVDSILDASALLGVHALGLDELAAQPISLGGGTVKAAHGVLPVPGPAVRALLAG